MRVLYVLLVLVPVTIALELLGAGPTWVFLAAAAALIPVSATLGKATEELAVHTGPRIGGLLNVTLGNAAELIITLAAIRADLFDLVRASIAGSILGNILLVLGASLLFGGLRHGRQRFDAHLAGITSTMMTLAVVALVLPGVFTQGPNQIPESRVEALSLIVASVLLLLYVLYLLYTIVLPTRGRATTSDPGDPAGPAAVEAMASGPAPSKPAHAEWSLWFGLGVLAASTVAAVVMSELLIGAIEPVALEWGITELFLGVILVPLVGNVAEHVAAVFAAMRNQMDLSLTIALGSSLQIALFVAPILTFVSLALGHPLTLVFNFYELTAMGAAVVIATLIAVDGESNWVEGAQLLAVYAMAGVGFFLLS